jgi:hypothetical protein
MRRASSSRRWRNQPVARTRPVARRNVVDDRACFGQGRVWKPAGLSLNGLPDWSSRAGAPEALLRGTSRHLRVPSSSGRTTSEMEEHRRAISAAVLLALTASALTLREWRDSAFAVQRPVVRIPRRVQRSWQGAAQIREAEGRAAVVKTPGPSKHRAKSGRLGRRQSTPDRPATTSLLYRISRRVRERRPSSARRAPRSRRRGRRWSRR